MKIMIFRELPKFEIILETDHNPVLVLTYPMDKKDIKIEIPADGAAYMLAEYINDPFNKELSVFSLSGEPTHYGMHLIEEDGIRKLIVVFEFDEGNRICSIILDNENALEMVKVLTSIAWSYIKTVTATEKYDLIAKGYLFKSDEELETWLNRK